jgi:DNA-binding CsgD family transcriptional regulator
MTAWRWVGRLGMPLLNDAEPLPGFVYAVAARVAASADRPPKPVRVRLQDAFGRWAAVRAAQLTYGTSPVAQGGYAVTLEQARSEDLAPLLMRAWALSPREREVARLVLDGLSNEDIAAALFISANTVRDHLKAIFGKTGVTRRRDLTAALAGLKPAFPVSGCPRPQDLVVSLNQCDIAGRRSLDRIDPSPAEAARAAPPVYQAGAPTAQR